MQPHRQERRKRDPEAATDVRIRPLSTHHDYAQCVALQRSTWGDDFQELVPPALLMIVQKLGGVAIGAFADDGSLSGFVFGLTGIRQGERTHWSHMLAVREDRRDRGIGRMLKESQRDHVRALGIRRMQWSFDPLVARNAHLNVTVLGARVTAYVEDMYGDNPLSRTDSVIGSDRLVVDWLIDEPARPTPPPIPEDAPLLDLASGTSTAAPTLAARVIRIAIPPDIQDLKQHRPDDARRWRVATRNWFTACFARGYEVRGFLSVSGTPGGTYVLERAAHHDHSR